MIHNSTVIEKGAKIGKNVKIGKNSQIGSNTIIESNVEIGDNCSIGSNVIIRKSIIGNNVRIGGGSGVIKDIPDNTIVQFVSGSGSNANDVALSNKSDLIPDGGGEAVFVSWQANNKTGGRK